ncbi:SMC-Scp complex subunit ScpB [Marispirochaeta aestuarii]|uniref:SMC-Scp complex subunit ScpB n=1 Tax=Marispirochaeta aestuarii TaxID=1963862 RepID=A0A1Y1S1U3_9SPIO|nr:SMC-Scp complex subunit ScpB [Marispirochaeta aestuarii]ORC36588.1 SMC-Scp complex subunit ScpB [Marispirochaeta aestuarii]
MTLEREAAIIEAILFLESEPIDVKTIAKISRLDKDIVEGGLKFLEEHYAEQGHGLDLREIGGGFLLSPKEELWDDLKERYGKKNDAKLSRAAMETLSIIAYSQPITRGEIEGIRGVSADGMIKLLLGRNLIKEVGKKEAPGRPVQYGTTKEFLKVFRLRSIADLPKLDELNQDRFELDGR